MAESSYYGEVTYGNQSLPPAPVPQMASPAGISEPRPKKQKRIRRACDFCHSRSTKCRQNPEGESCLVCLEFQQPCTYDRPEKKRGIPGKQYRPPSLTTSIQSGGPVDKVPSNPGEIDARMLLNLTSRPQVVSEAQAKFEQYKSLVIANQKNVIELVGLFFEHVQPIYPLFHSNSMRMKMAEQRYLVDLQSLIEVLAVCAITSAKVADLGNISSNAADHPIEQVRSTPVPEIYYEAAHDLIPRFVGNLKGLYWMRILGLMSLYGFQTGRNDILHHYLGQYCAVLTMDGFDDEASWPKDYGVIDHELGRRLVWSMYSLESLISITQGRRNRFRENRINVNYPSELHDALISDEGYIHGNSMKPDYPKVSSSGGYERIRQLGHWIHGWNFTIDLYRALSRCNYFETMYDGEPRGYEIPFGVDEAIELSESASDDIMSLYAGLPQRFKEWQPERPLPSILFTDDYQDVQAVHILLTLQLVRMTLVNKSSHLKSAEEKIAFVSDVLNKLNQIPFYYLTIVCTPNMYHITGLCNIVQSVLEGRSNRQQVQQISVTQAIHIIHILRDMATLIGRVEGQVNPKKEVSLAKGLYEKAALLDVVVKQFSADKQFTTSEMELSALHDDNIDPALVTPQTNQSTSGDRITTNNQQKAETWFHVPESIIKDWPWNFDISRGFGMT